MSFILGISEHTWPITNGVAHDGKSCSRAKAVQGHTFGDSGINLQGKSFLFNAYKSQFPICNYNNNLPLLSADCVPGSILRSFYEQ